MIYFIVLLFLLKITQAQLLKILRGELLNNHTPNDEDRAIEGRMRDFNKSLNSSISELSTVANMESSLNAQLELFDDNYQIKNSP